MFASSYNQLSVIIMWNVQEGGKFIPEMEDQDGLPASADVSEFMEGFLSQVNSKMTVW